LKNAERLSHTKLIILKLILDYLNFAVKDKKLQLPNHYHDNKFYGFDADDLSVEELLMQASEEDNEEGESSMYDTNQTHSVDDQTGMGI
jgi:cytidylate kinase